MFATGTTSGQGTGQQTRPLIPNLKVWLTETQKVSGDGKYRHRKLKEDHEKRALVLEDIKSYFRWAHRDTIQWIKTVLGDSLDPLGEDGYTDQICNYPCNLKLAGLQGCFGEVFAECLAENCDIHDVGRWEVPAFLSRFHNTAFEELEARNPYNDILKNAFGRTGDDCLAFWRNWQDGEIFLVLYCEAKCSLSHNASLINDAHAKLNHGRPVNILQIVDILQQRGDAESLAWLDPLRRARMNLRQANGRTVQLNLLSYICGQHPVKKETWMDPDKPHIEYKATARLEAMEIHLNEVESLIRAVYDEKEWP